MCIQRCFRDLTLKKNQMKSSQNIKTKKKSARRFDDGQSTGVGGKMKKRSTVKSRGGATGRRKDKNDPHHQRDGVKESSDDEKTLSSRKPEKDNSHTRSFYNTFPSEHFENAQITSHVPYKPIDLAAALKCTEEAPSAPRSTEEMRGNTLHKVLDDFPNIILPPLKNVDQTLPYVRQLNLQVTPTPSNRERQMSPRRLWPLRIPLSVTPGGSPAEGSPRNLGFKSKLMPTQSDKERLSGIPRELSASEPDAHTLTKTIPKNETRQQAVRQSAPVHKLGNTNPLRKLRNLVT